MSTPTGSAHERMMRLLHAPVITQALAVAAELRLADLVAEGPRDVKDLADASGTDPGALHRVLRALAAEGVFTETAAGTFAATPLSDTLRGGADSLRDWARLWGLPERNAALGALRHSVRTGQPSFPHLYGTSWWTHLATHPEQAAIFAGAMGDLSRRLHAATLDAYDLSDVSLVVDVGGGHGHLVAELLRRHPRLRAVLLDQPAVVARAAAVLGPAGVADRAETVGGDFFTAVPPGADVYLMSMILHDWDDERAATLLGAVRRAMRDDSVLLVVDAIVPAGDVPHDGKIRDLIMLTLHPGRERTEAEFAALFAGSGLRLTETREVGASTGLLVARPAD
ncbi:methyltransferase [Micromonospora mangrovi]|uniref:Methyltransferase n=2 Tax=Micromonospora TaxID=1873 RepID=A0AAU8HFC9_9ACTN